jgi:hypothetical protein
LVTPNTFQLWLGEQSVPLAIIFGCLLAGFLLLYMSARRRRSELVRDRAGITEKSFVSHMAAYDFDTNISANTYQYLQEVQLVDFPILPSDALDEDLGLDSDDVKETVRDLLIRTGRSFRPGILTAPIVTVEDLVRYLQASPRMEETRELVTRAS